MGQLEDFVRGATRVLEIGTGYAGQTMAIAQALPAASQLITVEANQQVARTAREQIAAAGLSNRAVVMIGPPARFLHKIAGPFDLIVHIGVDDHADEPFRSRLAALLENGGTLLTADMLTATKTR
jgi:predicted O-methyltransferase YrrM